MNVQLVLLLAFSSVSIAFDTTIVKGNADQIMRCVLSDGSIAVSSDIQDLIPYWSHFAAFGLAKAATALANKAYSNAAWNWLLWAQNHQNPTTNYITDYTRSGNTWVSTNTMDSTDSYAAFFLIALHATYAADKNLTRLGTYRSGITRSVAAIQSTINQGMTFALPTYQIKYLEDNVEVAAGLLACVQLAKVLGMSTQLTTCQLLYSQVSSNILTSMYNTDTADYQMYLGAGSPDWTLLYPDAESQMWPIAFGILTGSSASGLVNNFDANQPDWADPTVSGVGWDDVTCGWAFLQVGNMARAKSASAGFWQAAVNANFAWPYHVGAAGAHIFLELGQPFSIASL